MNQELPDIQSGKGKDLEKTGNQRSNCPHMLNHRKNKGTTKQKTNTHAHTHRHTHKPIYFCFIDYAKVLDCVNHNKLCNILKEMGIPDHLACLLRNLYAGQEATVRIGHKTMD